MVTLGGQMTLLLADSVAAWCGGITMAVQCGWGVPRAGGCSLLPPHRCLPQQPGFVSR